MRLLASAMTAALLIGCATPPISPAEQSKQYLTRAVNEFRTGSSRTALMYFNFAMDIPGQQSQVRAAFDASPGLQRLYVDETVARLGEIVAPEDLRRIYDRAGKMAELGVITPTESNEIRDGVIMRAQAGNHSGEVPFLLSDKIQGFGLLESREHMKGIVARTLDAENEVQRVGLVQTIVSYAADPSTPADQRKLIENSLDRLYVQRSDLPYVATVFPSFAKRREAFLNAAGELATRPVIVRQSIWDGLSEIVREEIASNYRMAINPDSEYGLISDVQTVNRSSAGSNAGSVVGAGIAQVAYIDRSFNNMNYSPWMQMGVGILGAIAGSAVNSAPTEQYQHFYTVRRFNGEMFKADQMTNTPDRFAPGTCVTVPMLSPVSQRICEETPAQLEQRLLSPLRST